jgi:hypothetical protein
MASGKYKGTRESDQVLGGVIKLNRLHGLSLLTMEDSFVFPCQNVIHGFDAHHNRVIHVTDFVTPRSKTAARVDTQFHQRRLKNS